MSVTIGLGSDDPRICRTRRYLTLKPKGSWRLCALGSIYASMERRIITLQYCTRRGKNIWLPVTKKSQRTIAAEARKWHENPSKKGPGAVSYGSEVEFNISQEIKEPDNTVQERFSGEMVVAGLRVVGSIRRFLFMTDAWLSTCQAWRTKSMGKPPPRCSIVFNHLSGLRALRPQMRCCSIVFQPRASIFLAHISTKNLYVGWCRAGSVPW